MIHKLWLFQKFYIKYQLFYTNGTFDIMHMVYFGAFQFEVYRFVRIIVLKFYLLRD